ncbi:MAG: hypothetical protein IBX70_13695 [Clostridia bacterium]|nr:hypothetical protein [Clostridia bacterium]
MKKIIVLVLLLSLATGLSYADEKGITLEEAYTILPETTLQSELDDMNISQLELALDEVLELASANIYVYNAESEYNKFITQTIKPFLAQAELDRAMATKASNIESQKLELEKMFMEIHVQEYEVEYLKKVLASAEDELDKGKVRFQLNQISSYEVSKLEYDLSKVESDLYAAELNLKGQFDDLKVLLAIEPDMTIAIDYELVLRTPPSEVKEDPTMTYLRAKLEAAQMTSDLSQSLFQPYESEWSDDQLALLLSQLSYEKYANSIIANEKNQYNTYLIQLNNYELSLKYLQLMQEQLLISQQKADLSLISEDALTAVEFAYEKAKLATLENLVKVMAP